jgi:hypothetical protein
MEDLAERRSNYPSRSHSVSSYVPIDPFKPSVAYGRKNLMTPATPRRATTMDDNPKVANRHQVAYLLPEASHAPLPLDHNDHTQLPPGFVPMDSYIPPLDNDRINLPPPLDNDRINLPPSLDNDRINLPPPFEFTRTRTRHVHFAAPSLESFPDPPLESFPDPIAHPLPQRKYIPWGITDQRTSSPTPIVESASFGFSDCPLPVIGGDRDVDIWEEYRGSGGLYQ